MKRASLTIAGRVQGVGFRASCLDLAQTLGVKGWVRNGPGGTVEAVGEGDPKAVEAWIEWCRKGPPPAKVLAVGVKWQEPRGETDFRIVE